MGYYYLLRIGKYTMKLWQLVLQQTIPFVMGNVSLFDENESGEMRRTPHDVSKDHILWTKGAVLRVQQ